MTLKDRSSSVLSINKTLVHFYYTSIESILLYSIYHYLSMVCVCMCVCNMVHIYMFVFYIYQAVFTSALDDSSKTHAYVCM